MRQEYAKNNPLSESDYNYLAKTYYDGYGFKVIARCLGITYTNCRTLLIKYIGITTRTGCNITTAPTRQFRKNRVSGNKSPWYNWPENKPDMLKNHHKTGIQGYYKKRDGSLVWLRSTWEYVYARWLDKQNTNWSYEISTFVLLNGETYRPDFTIHEIEGDCIIEVKGCPYQSRLYKVDMFKQEYPKYKIIVVDDIKPFCVQSYGKEVKEWKQKRILNSKKLGSKKSVLSKIKTHMI